MTAVIWFSSDAYSIAGPKLMGRNAAGASFLRGFVEHSSAGELLAHVEQRAEAQAFADVVAALGTQKPARVIGNEHSAVLANAGTLYYPGTAIGRLAWKRAPIGHTAWSICGVTHTTASARAMSYIADVLVAPIQPWDALICTSNAVKDNVTRVLTAQAEFLKDRLGATKLPLPQLPVIPLGIHTRDFASSPAQRADARRALGAQEGSIVVLYVGRLSFHAKAHPLAMYTALEKAAATVGSKVMLVECGWHGNEFSAHAFAEAAATACQSVEVRTLDGRQDADRRTAWAAADIFCSLADNIQESFGLTPIEAMAAGLPVVVSDWDGYRDTIRDGVDGFKIPTIMPSGGLGRDLAVRHALEIDTGDRYFGYASTMVAVDVDATAAAFATLFRSPDLRAEMGASGQRRAREVYDWSVIVPRYEVLWTELAASRRAASPSALKHPWPARLDPFHAFASYPTRQLGLQTKLTLVDPTPGDARSRLAALRGLEMVKFADAVLPTPEETDQVFTALANGPDTMEAVLRGLPAKRQGFVGRSLTWLVKLNLLRVVSD